MTPAGGRMTMRSVSRSYTKPRRQCAGQSPESCGACCQNRSSSAVCLCSALLRSLIASSQRFRDVSCETPRANTACRVVDAWPSSANEQGKATARSCQPFSCWRWVICGRGIFTPCAHAEISASEMANPISSHESADPSAAYAPCVKTSPSLASPSMP